MRTSSNRISQNELFAHTFGRATHVRRVQCGRLTLGNMFMVLLVAFVTVAAMQAFQLNNLLSDAKAVGQDGMELRAEQKIILDVYSNRLSGHIRN